MPNYINKVKTQTSLTRFATRHPLILQAHYILRTPANEWQKNLRAWMRNLLAPRQRLLPAFVAHCNKRARLVSVPPPHLA